MCCSALITINDKFVLLHRNFFPEELEYMKLLLYCWYAALFVVLSGIMK